MSDYRINSYETTPSATLKPTVLLIHGLYAASFVTGFTSIIGVVLAYLKRDDARGTIYESHITYAIRTFWLSIALVVAGFVLAFVGIGLLIWAFSFVWYIVRVARPILATMDNRAIPNPHSFF